MVLFRSVENYQLVVENDQWKTTSAQFFSIVAQVATIGWKVQMCLVSHIQEEFDSRPGYPSTCALPRSDRKCGSQGDCLKLPKHERSRKRGSFERRGTSSTETW